MAGTEVQYVHLASAYQKKEPGGSRRIGVGSCSHAPMDIREQKLKLVDLRKVEAGA